MNENPLVVVSQALASPDMRRQFQTLLPSEIPVDRFTEVVQMAIRQTPEVLQADRQTLYDACLQLARRGLMPDKKESALVIFSTKEKVGNQEVWIKKVQAMPMVEGIIKELGKAGVKSYAVSVYSNDSVRLWNDDDGQHVHHEPVTFGERGSRVGCFAAGKMADGRTYVEAMNMDELERVALRSKQAKKDNNSRVIGRGGTWASDPERMEQKSALHRLRKRIPIIGAEEALQNLKDMEDESDIDLTSEDTSDLKSGVVPDPQMTVYQGIKPATTRPKALQAVMDQVAKPEPETINQEDDII